jgi:fatty acid desaturase
MNWLLGLIVFYPPEYFRFWHLTHHRFTQDRERDPEIVPPPVTSRAGYVWWVIGVPYLLRRTETLKIALTGRIQKAFVPEQRKAEIVREARITWAVYLTVAVLAAFLDPWAPVLYWLGPYVLAQPVLRLYQLAEHTGMEFTDDTLRNTRTTRSNALVRWLAWNMPYHTEHHLYPGVPFHALPRLHRLVKDRLPSVSPGYVRANQGIWGALH